MWVFLAAHSCPHYKLFIVSVQFDDLGVGKGHRKKKLKKFVLFIWQIFLMSPGLKTHFLLSANILDYHILQVLKYELKTFHSYVQHSKTYVWLFFNFHSTFLNVLYLLLQAMSLRQKRMRLGSQQGRRGRPERRLQSKTR